MTRGNSTSEGAPPANHVAKNLIRILIGLAVILAGLAVVISRKPSHFEVTRSMVMPVPADKVFPLVNDLHRWEGWSPWVKMDPDSKATYEGPASGIGASMSWVGKKTGEGRMTVTDSRPNELVLFKLEFFKPFKASNTAQFTFKPEGAGTLVSWSMSGESNFLAKAMSLVMDCEKMLAPMFDQGLASMKQLAVSAR